MVTSETQGASKLTDSTLTPEGLGRLVFETLQVTGQDEIEVLTDKTDKNRLMIQKHAGGST